MAEIERKVSIAIDVTGNVGTKIPEIAGLLKELETPIANIGKSLATLGTSIKNFGTDLGAVKSNIPDLTSFSTSLSNLANKAGSDKLNKLSDSLTSFKDIKLPANFDKFVKGLKDAGSAGKPPDFTKFVDSAIRLSGIKGIPVSQLTGLSGALKGFKNITGLPQKSLEAFAAALLKLKDVKGIRSENLKNIATALDKFSKVKLPTGDRITKFVDGLKGLTAVKGIRVTNLKNIGDALRTFGSLTKIPSLATFIKNLQTLAKVNLTNLTTVAQQITALAKATASLSNSLPSVTSKLNNNATAAGKTSQSMKKLNTSVKQVDSTYGNFMKKIERYAQYRLIADSIIGLKEAFYTGFQEIVNYDQALKDLQAITSSTAGQVEQMGTVIKQVASDTKFSATEVAVGMRTLGQAGFSAQEGIDAMEHISNLATGTLSSMEQAVDLVSTAIRVYGADQLDAAKASDVFANAVNKSKLTIDKIRTAFNYVGPIAKNAGVSFEETATAMAVLANAGLKSSKIGTGLRRVLAELVDPNKKLAKAAKEAGLSLNDLNPQENDLDKVLRNLSIILTDSAVAFDLFGKRGAAAALTLTQDATAFKTMHEVIGESGTAAEMAEIQMEGLGVSFKNLRDKLTLVMVALGEAGLIKGLKVLVDMLRAAVDGITEFINSDMGKMTLQMTAFGVASLAVLKTMSLLKAAFIGLKGVGFLNFLLEANVAMGGVAAASKLSVVQLDMMNRSFIGASVAAGGLSTSVKAATVSLRTLMVAMAPFLAAFLTVAAVVLTVGLALAGAAYAWKLFKRDFISGSQDITKETFKTKEALEGVLKSFESYKTDVAGLDKSSDKYLNRNKELRKEILKVVQAQGELSGSATAAVNSINALTGEFIDGGAALKYYIEQTENLKWQKTLDGVASLSDSFREATNGVNSFWSKTTSLTGQAMHKLVTAFNAGEIGLDEFLEGVEDLKDKGGLDGWSKGVVKNIGAMSVRISDLLHELSTKGLIDADTTIEELMRIPDVMKVLRSDSGITRAFMTKNFTAFSEAVNKQQSAIIERWKESGSVFKTAYDDMDGIYGNLREAVKALTNEETQRVADFENSENRIMLALQREEAMYKAKKAAYVAARAAAIDNASEVASLDAQNTADAIASAKIKADLMKELGELNKKVAKDPTVIKLRAIELADFKHHQAEIEAGTAKTQDEVNRIMVKASAERAEALRLAHIPIVDEDELEKELDAVEANRDSLLAANEVFAAKNESNAGKAKENELAIQEQYYIDSIALLEAYHNNLEAANKNDPRVKEAFEDLKEKQREQYDELLGLAADYYEKLNDLRDDQDDLEDKLTKENKTHVKNIAKQLKAEEKFRDKKQDLWDDYQDKREDQLEKLSDLEYDYREDKLQAEKDLRDEIAGLEDSLEDKIAKKKQEGMSPKQKARDNEGQYYKKMKEANDLLAKGIKENDEGQIERAAEKAGQAQDLAEDFEKQSKSINGMTKANDTLIKAEEALAKVQAKERKDDYGEDKKDILDDLSTATKDYKEARDQLNKEFKAGQAAIKEALAEELGVRSDMYKDVEGFEAARHKQVVDDLQLEMDKVDALIAKFSQLAPETEQKAAAAKPESDAKSTSSKTGSNEAVKNVQAVGKAGDETIKTLDKVDKKAEEVAGNATYGLANSIVSGTDAAGKKLVDFVVVTLESGKKVITTAKEMGSAFAKFGKAISSEPLKAVDDLNEAIKKISPDPVDVEIEVQTEKTMKRAVSFMNLLQGKIKDIGLDYDTGIEFISPDQTVAIDAVAAKVSGLFSNLNTDDPKQKVQDMITTLEGVADPAIYDAMQKEILDFARTIDNVNVTLVEDDEGKKVHMLVDDAGNAITGLREDIQSNPFELFSPDFNKPIVDNVNRIQGVFVHLREQIGKEIKMKVDASEAKSSIEETYEVAKETRAKIEKDESRGYVIDPGQEAAVDALAQKISSLFSGFDTTEPVQKLQDMLTVVEAIVDPTAYQSMKEEIKKVATTVEGVNLAESFIVEDGTRKSFLTLVDDAGQAIVGLREDIQSDPFELFPAEFNQSILENINEVKGALDVIEGGLAEEFELKLKTKEAKEAIAEGDAAFEAFKVLVEEEQKLKLAVDKEQMQDDITDISEFGDDGYTMTIKMYPEVVNKEEVTKSVDDIHETAKSEVEKKDPINMSVGIGTEDYTTSLQDMGIKAEDVLTELNELDDTEVDATFHLEDEALRDSVRNDLDSFHEMKDDINNTPITYVTELEDSNNAVTLDNFHEMKDDINNTPITYATELEEQKPISEIIDDFHAINDDINNNPIVYTTELEEPLLEEAQTTPQEVPVEETVTESKVDKEELEELVELVNKFTGEDYTVDIQIILTGQDKLQELTDWLTRIQEDSVGNTIQVGVQGSEEISSVLVAINSLVGKVVQVVATVTGLDEVLALKAAIDSLQNKDVYTTNYVKTVEQNAAGGDVGSASNFAGGGDVFRKLVSPFIGIGSGIKDDVPAMLMKGEFVFKKSAVAKYGKELLHAMNNGIVNFTEGLPKYATGGEVSNSVDSVPFVGGGTNFLGNIPLNNNTSIQNMPNMFNTESSQIENNMTLNVQGAGKGLVTPRIRQLLTDLQVETNKINSRKVF